MKKKFVAIAMAMLIFAGNSMTAQAGVCPKSTLEDGVHLFNECKYSGMGRIDDLGYHTYLFGYDKDMNPIYHDDCKLTQPVRYCMYICSFCKMEQPSGGAHQHKDLIRHSISH